MKKHKINVENPEMLSNLIDSMPIAIVVFKNEKFVAANQKYLDYIEPEVRPLCKEGTPLLAFIDMFHSAMEGMESDDPEDDELRRTDKDAWIQQRLEIYRNDSEFENLDDGEWWKIINKYHPVDKTYIGIRVNIQDMKEAELRAEAADLAKSQFLANMSHEIRTPMNGILGMAELLGSFELPSKQKDFVNVIQRSGNALLTIINDILDFSKIEAGQLEIVPEPFILRDSIEDVMTLLAPRMTETEVDLLLRIQPDLPVGFSGDAGRLRQVLTNIVGNAVKFTNNGHVLVDVSGTSTAEKASLTFSIEDTGIGIPEDKIGIVFDKFNQADFSTTREYGGTGLGLNIARELVQLMGGDIDLESEIDKGSRFSFTIDMPVEAELQRTIPFNLNIKDAKILIVDDNLDNRNILTEQLTYWGCRSVAVESAHKAVGVLKRAVEKSFNFDLIVVDYHMPKVNGEGFVKAIKQHKLFKNIPVIMLSSVDRSDLQKRMSELDVSAFLTKPARASAFMNAINDAIYTSRTEISAPVKTAKTQPKALEVIPQTPSQPPLQEVVKEDNVTSITDIVAATDYKTDILIVDDNDVNRMYAKYLMEDMGFKYEVACDGFEAVEAWKTYMPKLILMDVSMPNMNGYEATAKIRELAKEMKRPKTPIIAVTAHSLKGDKEKCLAEGMDSYLSKPMPKESLKACLTEWGLLDQSGVKTA